MATCFCDSQYMCVLYADCRFSVLIVEDMIRLFKVKEKQRELAENANGGAPIKKQSAGELRLHKGDALLFDIT